MRFEDGKTQAWVVLSICGVLTLALLTIVSALLGRHADDWVKSMAAGMADGRQAARTAPAPARPPVPIAARPRDGRTPIPIEPASWIGTDDYPFSAVRAGEQGVVRAALDVDQAGRPVRCAIVETSGVAALDRATCHAFMRSGRFNRGAAAEGPGHIRHWPGQRVRWILPES